MCESCNSTQDLFYYSKETPNLPFLNLGNGTYLNTLLEKIDSIIGSEYPFDFNKYKMPYMKGKYTISTMKNFAESTSVELANLSIKTTNTVTTNTTNSADIVSLKTRVGVLEIPGINDTSFAGFTTTSTLKVVLQKLSDKIAKISSPQINPPLVVLSSKTVLLTSVGPTIGASVKISEVLGNKLEAKLDGLYVAVPTVNEPIPPKLSLSNAGVLSITGGSYVNLPAPILKLAGSILSIGDSSVDIGNVANVAQTPLTVVDSNTIDFTFTTNVNRTPTLTGDVKISSTANNQLKNTNGLYVAPASTAAILSEITLTSTYRATFNDLVKSSNIPLTFYIQNTGAPVNFQYIDINNSTKTILINTGGILLPTDVKQLTTFATSTLKIEFRGFSVN
jgi:hypothetical protein